MKPLLLFLSLSGCAVAANCNPSDPSGCPASWSSIGSSFALVTGTSFNAYYNNQPFLGAPNGVDCKAGVVYDTSHSSTNFVHICQPHGLSNPATVPLGVCIHGGGYGFSVSPPGCNWGSTQTESVIEAVQRCGCPVWTPEYPQAFSGTYGGHTFPQPIQAIKQLMWFIAANAGTSTLPGNPLDIRFLAQSAGCAQGLFAWLVPETQFPNYGSNAINTGYQFTMFAGTSCPIQWTYETANYSDNGANSSYALNEAHDTITVQVVNAVFPCSSGSIYNLTACRSVDIANAYGPLQYLIQSNYSRITGTNVLLIVGDGTPVDTEFQEPYNSYQAQATVFALSPSLYWPVFSGPHQHTSDNFLGFAGVSIPLTFNFLFGSVAQIGGASGASSAGGSSVM